MNLFKQLLFVGFLFVAIGGSANAALIDSFTGDYWYDWIGNQANGSYPETQVGEMTITSNSMSLDYYASPGGASGDFGFTFTETSLDGNGYLTMQASIGPVQVVANGNYVSRISDGSGDEPIAHGWMTRKADSPTLADIVGDYAVFRHGMRCTANGPTEEAEGVFGTAVFSTGSPDNGWSIDTTVLDSFGFHDLDATGSWTLNGTAGTVSLAGMGPEALEFKVGVGGLMTCTTIDAYNDNPARVVLVKKGAGRTVDDVVGRYTLQGFNSNTTGNEFWSTWGTLDIFSDSTWMTTTSNSSGADGAVATGTFTIDDDGTLNIVDSGGTTMYGAVNLDGDLLVLESMNPNGSGEVGVMFAVRPLLVPEPSMPALLIFSGLGGLACRLLRRKR